MDIDFTALASRVAARAEVLGCVILSSDGLVMGAFPPNGEIDVTPAWLRFASVGDPRRGFVEFEDELWAYVRRGPYAAFAVGAPRTRAGILIDYLEQALLAAEDSRELRAAVRRPETVDLNRERFGIVIPVTRSPEPAPLPAPAPPIQAASRDVPAHTEAPAFQTSPARPDQRAVQPRASSEWPAPHIWEDPSPRRSFESAPASPTTPVPDPPTPVQSEPLEPVTNPEDIDRVALAREFAHLLQDGPFGVEEGR